MQVAAPTNKLHPLIATAAIAVTAVSVLGAVVLVTTQVSARHAAPEMAIASSALPAPAIAADPATPALSPLPAAAPTAAPEAQSPAAAPVRRAAKPVSTEARVPAPVGRARELPAPRADDMPPTVSAQRNTVPTHEPVAQSPLPPPVCRDCGVVSSVREIKAPGEASGIGAIAGGVLGGVLGNQIGKGNGRDATRILGAIGGAVAGHQIEKRTRATSHYEITLQMEDGSMRTLTRTADPGVRSGDRVRLDGDRILGVDGRPMLPSPPPSASARIEV